MRAHHPRTPLTWKRGCCHEAGSPLGRSGGVRPRRWRSGGPRYDHAVQSGHLLWGKRRSLRPLAGATGHYAYSLFRHAVSRSVGLANCRIHSDIENSVSLALLPLLTRGLLTSPTTHAHECSARNGGGLEPRLGYC